LDRATVNLASYLQSSPDVNLADVAYTLQVGRKAFECRRFVVCKDAEDATKALTTLDPQRVLTTVSENSKSAIAFAFPGQGSQYVNMGRELYETEPTFQKEIDRCCQLLQSYLNLDLLSIVYPKQTEETAATEQLKQTSIAQPAIFVIEYALAQLWMSWGIKPQAAIGHSIGEYVAATLAGVFSLEDALKLVAIRGQLMQQLPQGAMLAVSLSEEEIKPLLGENISLATVNSPSNCVVSGQIEAIEALEKQLSEREIGCRRLHTSHAFHSSMMDAVVKPFAERVKQIKLHPPQMPYISNVTGTWITTEQATDPHYWAKHLRQTVRFADGLQTLLERSQTILLEVGAGRTLSTLAQYSKAKTLTSLRHPQETRSDRDFILNTLGQLWRTGVSIDWSGFYNGDRRQHLPLPTYPFERQRYWIEEGRRQEAEGRRDVWDLLVKSAQKQAKASVPQCDRATYLHKKQCLNRLCTAYMNQALRNLGAFSIPSDKYSREELLEQCQIIPRYRQLLHRWLQVLVEQGQLQEDKGYFSHLLATESIHSLLDEVRHAWEDTPQEIDLLQNCGDNLAFILTGKKEPLEFHVATLTEEGDIARQNSPLDIYYNTILRSSLEAIAKSSETNLRILEIGGGTGIATAELLPILSAEKTRYTFTDVGGLFLTQARKKFSHYPFVDYRALDIEKSPGEQGYTPHSCNVVVAVNVLHVARNLSKSLEYVCSLLAPKGFLLIREITEPQLDFDITDGLLMNAVEDEARKHGNPFLSREQWREILLAHGFDRVEIVPETDAFGQHIIVAQKSCETLAKKRDLDEWFYIPSWKRSLLPIPSIVEKQLWLLFVDECGIGEKLEQRLREKEQKVISVRVGEKFGCDRDRGYTIDPQQRNDYFTLFEALKGRLPSQIVYFWGVNPSDRDGFLSRAETIPPTPFQKGGWRRERDELETLSFYSLLWLAQALGEENLSNAVEVAIVSNDMQAVTGSEELCPVKSLLLGACKVISQEYPNINCRSIDIVLPSYRRQEEQLLEQLLAEIIICPPNPPTLGGEKEKIQFSKSPIWGGFRGQVRNSNLEQIVAYRGNHRWVQTYEPIKLSRDRTKPILRDKGVYLITGGLGGIGLVLAEYLAKTVQAKLILVGRSEFPVKEEWQEWLTTHEQDDEISRKIRQIQAIEALGSEFAILKADVADLEQMQHAIAQIDRIHGVIHAAGVTPGGTIQTKTAENAESILAPKVTGTLVLDTLFQDVPLDFLILCSSLTSILGGVGMADHCAANAFMDAFAYADAARNDKRLTVSVNWDSWQEVGQAAKTDVPKSLQKLREENLKQGILPQEGVKAFECILNSTVPQILVSTRNLEVAFLETEKLQSVQPTIDSRSGLPNAYVAPRDEMESAIANIWQEYLGIQPIGIHDDFFNLGGDSLLAVQIVSQIRKIFSVELKVNTLLSEATTIAQLADIISQKRTQIEEVGEIEQLLSELETLSPSEIQAELNKANKTEA
jgi:malonyl CoA-acyl carrier protein transacylase/NAD(P)-dependent dehydrogenase (short-subunit alcohol dehydrogenase family)/acyl carrier protein/SAM-dependent methyltransferase